jgi:hypothetical protein
MVNWEGCGRKLSWSNLKLHPRVFLKGLKKATKNLSQDSQTPGRDLKPGHPKHETGVLTTEPRRFVSPC